jgi:hypothetical protein
MIKTITDKKDRNNVCVKSSDERDPATKTLIDKRMVKAMLGAISMPRATEIE